MNAKTLWINLLTAVCRKMPAARMDMRRWFRLERLAQQMCRYSKGARA